MRQLGAKDAKKAYVHSMNGLEGKREEKTRQEGSEGEKGMAERGTGQPEGSPPASQGNEPTTAWLLFFGLHCKENV